MNRWTRLAAVGAGAALSCAPVAAQAQTLHDFRIPPQPLESALLQFADQSGVSLALPDAGVGDARTDGVVGRVTEAEALTRLLSRSGFRFERAGEHAYRVIAAPRPRAATGVTTSDAVIVTAARRPSSLQDLPRSLSDVDERRLDQLPAHESNGLASEMSGVLFSDVGAGRDKIYIRGISDGAVSGHAQSTVGIYLDGVRLTYAAPDPQLQLVDVARVDVLRGPQGALYGAGSIGGIFSIESNPPDVTEFSGSILGELDATQGGGVGTNAEVVLNAPIIPDRLAGRFAGYDQRVAGWLDNTTTGSKDTNEVRRRGARLSAELDLGANWRLRAFVANQTIDAADSQYLADTPAGHQRTARLLEPHDNDFLMAGGALHGRTGLGIVDATTAIVRHEVNNRYDATGGFAVFGVDPSAVVPLDEQNTLDILVHETRLSSPAGASLPWFLGMFYADGDNSSERVLHDGTIDAYHERRRDAIDEMAIFGEAIWRLSPVLTLSTGLRAFQYDVRVSSSVAEDVLGLSSQMDERLKDRGVAPDLRLSYQPRAHMLFYLAASEGYRSAGFNSGEPVGEALSTTTQPFRRYVGDELWTYEAGAHLSLLEGRLSVSSAAFLNDWRRLQTDELISGNLTYTGNAGSARAWGFESDTRFDLTDALTMRAHLLINEPEFSRRDLTFPIAVDSLPGAPEIALSGSLSYERDISFGESSALVHAEAGATFVGDSASAFATAQHRDSYTRTDASVSLTSGNIEVLLYAENVFDVAGTTFSAGNPYSVDGPFVTELRPLTLGVALRRRF